MTAEMGTTKAARELQELVFTQMERGSFNNFDGEKVVASLRAHPELWKAVIATDDRNGALTLRDLNDGDWHIDSVYVKCRSERASDLLALIEAEWEADEVDVLSSVEKKGAHHSPMAEAAGRGEVIVRAWWD